MNKKDILFLCQFFYPENNSSATLPFDTARFLAEKGYSVDVLCGFPKEYTNQIGVNSKETVENVCIQRIRYIQLDRKKKISRLINYFSFTFAVLMRILKLRKYKCVIVYSNPPVLPFVPALVNLLFGTQFVFVTYDIYPEVAYASGTVRQGDFIDRLSNLLNKMIFKRVSKVVALTDEMKAYLIENRKSLSEDRVTVIPNWAHEEMMPNSKVHFCDEEAENRPFVISYIGNMGTCQEMETLARGVEILRNRKDIFFQFVGHGNKASQLKERFAGVSNVRFLDFLTGDELNSIVRESSCFVVSLEKGIRGMCAPSKYYSYLYFGKPIIAIVEKESYLYEEVEKRKIGYGVEIGDVDRLIEVISSMAKDSRGVQTMGKNAADVYERYYSTKHVRDRYYCLLEEILH